MQNYIFDPGHLQCLLVSCLRLRFYKLRSNFFEVIRVDRLDIIWSVVWHRCPDGLLTRSLCLWPLTPCRGGALQPRTRLWEGLVPPAPSPERQPGSALWLQQPSERGSLPVHTEPPGGLFHPAAAGTSSPTPHGPNIVSVTVHSPVSERSEPPAYGGCLRTWLKIKVQEKMKRENLKGYYFFGREE